MLERIFEWALDCLWMVLFLVLTVMVTVAYGM